MFLVSGVIHKLAEHELGKTVSFDFSITAGLPREFDWLQSVLGHEEADAKLTYSNGEFHVHVEFKKTNAPKSEPEPTTPESEPTSPAA